MHFIIWILIIDVNRFFLSLGLRESTFSDTWIRILKVPFFNTTLTSFHLYKIRVENSLALESSVKSDHKGVVRSRRLFYFFTQFCSMVVARCSVPWSLLQCVKISEKSKGLLFHLIRMRLSVIRMIFFQQLGATTEILLLANAYRLGYFRRLRTLFGLAPDQVQKRKAFSQRLLPFTFLELVKFKIGGYPYFSNLLAKQKKSYFYLGYWDVVSWS